MFGKLSNIQQSPARQKYSNSNKVICNRPKSEYESLILILSIPMLDKRAVFTYSCDYCLIFCLKCLIKIKNKNFDINI